MRNDATATANLAGVQKRKKKKKINTGAFIRASHPLFIVFLAWNCIFSGATLEKKKQNKHVRTLTNVSHP